MEKDRNDERRESTRVQLDIPCFVMIKLASGDSFKAMISNIGYSGIQLDLPAALSNGQLAPKALVTISGFPKELAMLNNMRAKVKWLGDGRCGLHFEKKLSISEEELLDIIEQF